MSISNLLRKKQQGEKITMLTCYDFPSAKTLAQSRVDIAFVGDSVATAVHGHINTTMATIDMMLMHTQAVARGLGKQLLLVDLPFLCHRQSQALTIEHVTRLIQSGAQAIKIEGGDIDTCETIAHLVTSGIPIFGHIGLTPQFVYQLGGYKIQGREENQAAELLLQAKRLQTAGCAALVIECVPEILARKITESLSIPTIGIGAGAFTDGQVLVWHDLLGLHDFKPKFLKQYAQGSELMLKAINHFVDEVKTSVFPSFLACIRLIGVAMETFDNIASWQNVRNSFDPKLKIGFVPTMGNLHQGHAFLVKQSKKENDLTIVSIFINPTQFDNANDLKFYPRTLEADKLLLTELGVNYCFMPNYTDIYADNYRYKIEESELALIMEGAHRKSHFTGVLTIVMKLLNLIRPNSAYFGEKDYQQYLLIKNMAEAFFMNVKIHACSTIRENSALALSSRNNRLLPEQRDLAEVFAKIFHQPKSCEEITVELEQAGIKVDYVKDWENRRFAAVKIGEIRLIDNYAKSHGQI